MVVSKTERQPLCAFAISFVAIAAAWNHHHDVFQYVTSMDPRLRTPNTLWLPTIILNPFATRLLTSRGHETIAVQALRFGFYSLLQALGAASLIAILHHVLSHAQAPGMPPRVASRTNWGSFAIMIGFGLSILVFFATTNAWALWFVAPPLARQVYQFRHRDGRTP
ncbi:MAG TPA: TMEM175 family protein [Acidimicrobiales bacterium]|nr:TMEM175 family protein [Acidimicrobiales bacterium]